MLRLLYSYSCHDADACRIDEAMVTLKVECSGKLRQYVVIDVAIVSAMLRSNRSRPITRYSPRSAPTDDYAYAQ